MLAGIQSEIKQLQAEEARAAGAARRARPRRGSRAQQRAACARRTSGGRDRRRRLLRRRSTAAQHADPLDPRRAHRSQYGGVVGIAMQYLGKPVRLGRRRARAASTARASSRTSTPRSASRCRTTPPRSTATARRSSYDDLQPGDLVFFAGLGHVGIYIGGGQFIHAPHTGDVVKISSLSEHGGYVGARRLCSGFEPVRRSRRVAARRSADAGLRSKSASTASGEVLHDRAALQLQRRRHLVAAPS